MTNELIVPQIFAVDTLQITCECDKECLLPVSVIRSVYCVYFVENVYLYTVWLCNIL